jgi:hypothetical protein
MKFEHTVLVAAPRQKVREFLDDFEQAAKCVPGLEEVHEVGPDLYEGRVRLRVGPLGFSIAGRARLERGAETEGWKLQGEGRDRRIGAGVIANVEANLKELGPSSTEVLMQADMQFSGRLAELGQPLIKRKSDSMVREFAENLKKALE